MHAFDWRSAIALFRWTHDSCVFEPNGKYALPHRQILRGIADEISCFFSSPLLALSDVTRSSARYFVVLVMRSKHFMSPLRAFTDIILCHAGFLLLKSTEVDSLNMSLLRTLRYPARDAQHCPSAVFPETKRRRCLNTPKVRLYPNQPTPTDLFVLIRAHTVEVPHTVEIRHQ